MYIFICEDSIDGIFTGVYDAWASKYGHNNVSLTTCTPENYSLFCDYITVDTNFYKSEKVAQTLISRLGSDVYSEICQAAAAIDQRVSRRPLMDKADAIYRTIVLALSLKDGSKVLTYLGEPYVNRVFKLSLSSGNEAHHLLGFLRFHELENGILFARIHPQNDVLALIADHFTDRLPQENFMILDESRKKAALHQKGSNYFITNTDSLDESKLNRFSKEELEYQKLWCAFFESIAIKGRLNGRLQNQNIPKRFQKDVIEFQSTQKTPSA